MIDLGPPPLWTPARPAIIQAAEPWEVRAHSEMIRRGIPRNVRRAIVLEIARLAGARKVLRPAFEDLARFAELPALASFLPGMFPAASPSTAAPSVVSVTFHDTDGSESDLTAYTFTAMDIGTANAGRIVVAGFAWRQTADRTVSSVLIGGVGATEAVTSHSNTGGASLWAAVVPTGTTADVVVTLSSGALRMGCATWSLIGASSVVAAQASDSVADPASLSLTFPAGGVGIGLAWTGNAAPSLTWTGLNEDFDLLPGSVGAGWTLSGASLASTPGGIISISGDYDTASTAHAVSATWGP